MHCARSLGNETFIFFFLGGETGESRLNEREMKAESGWAWGGVGGVVWGEAGVD